VEFLDPLFAGSLPAPSRSRLVYLLLEGKLHFCELFEVVSWRFSVDPDIKLPVTFMNESALENLTIGC